MTDDADEGDAWVTGQGDRNARRPLQTMPWWVAVIGTLAVAASAAGTMLWLLSIAGHNAQLRIEAIKVGLSVGAGTGGAVALMLAVRRQWLSERTQAHAEDVARDNAYDATQRRVTELYGKAVEQLGHTSAAVRLGGLYSLERLAQDHTEHRQTVVDVICSYLRMPFQPPASPLAGERHTSPKEVPGDRSEVIGDDDSDAREELQVRLAAQRLLARHLEFPRARNTADQHATTADNYWAGMRIDLTGAYLEDFSLVYCQPDYADFRKARFGGVTEFDEAQFSRFARFECAQFGGKVSFRGTQFEHALFGRAKFCETAQFEEARFSGLAMFDGVRFSGVARFGRAQFSGVALFEKANFSSEPDFVGAEASHPNDQHIWPDGWHIEPSSSPGMAPLAQRR